MIRMELSKQTGETERGESSIWKKFTPEHQTASPPAFFSFFFKNLEAEHQTDVSSMFFLEKFPGSDAQTPRLTYRITVWKLSFRAMIVLFFGPHDRLESKDFSDKSYFFLATFNTRTFYQIDINMIVVSSNPRPFEDKSSHFCLWKRPKSNHVRRQFENASLGNWLQIFLNASSRLLPCFLQLTNISGLLHFSPVFGEA